MPDQPAPDFEEALRLLNEICLDSLEVPLDHVDDPNAGDGNVSDLFRRLRAEIVALLSEREAREERLAALEGPHVLVLGDDRWTIEHDLACRESGQMADCEIHRRVADWIDEIGEPPLAKGRYSIADGPLPDALSALPATESAQAQNYQVDSIDTGAHPPDEPQGDPPGRVGPTGSGASE